MRPMPVCDMAPDLQLHDLRVTSREGRVLLDVPALHIPGGQTLALRGPSGAGKSTLLHVLSGLVRPAHGRILWGGRDIAALSEDDRARFRRDMLGLIFQDSHLFEELSAFRNAALAAAFSRPERRGAIHDTAARWLTRLGLPQTGTRTADSYSGGERQRIAVARALAADPPVILADEPTAALDRDNADRLGRDLVTLAAEGRRTLIAVTHDPALAGQMQRRITLTDGRITGDEA